MVINTLASRTSAPDPLPGALLLFAMVFRWIVNAGLLVVPIGATIGVLLGIESHRQATGQAPLFAGDGDSDGSTGGGNVIGGSNGITISQYCQASYGVSPPSKGLEYTCKWDLLGAQENPHLQTCRQPPPLLISGILTDRPPAVNPNQWGWTEGEEGGLCLDVRTYPELTAIKQRASC